MKNKIWIWGQDVQSHHYVGIEQQNLWNLPGENKMGTMEGAAYLGIRNCCRVAMNGKPEPPFDEEAEKLISFNKVVWSIIGDSGSARNGDKNDDLQSVLDIAKKFPNITGGVLDDFFRPLNGHTDGQARLPLERVAAIRDALHGAIRPLELWVVIYETALTDYYRQYLELCDCLTFWTWNADNLPQLPENIARLRELAPGKKILAGCYLWDYGNACEMPMGMMRFQCAFFEEQMRAEQLEGVIICSNCIADIGLESVEFACKWINNLN